MAKSPRIITNKSEELTGDALSGEFDNTAKCEHRICPVKYFIG